MTVAIKKYTYDNLKYMLERNICGVHFTKVDGSSRRMKCTLNPHLIPKNKMRALSAEAGNLEFLPVYDLDKDDWRAFRFDRINSFWVYVPADSCAVLKEIFMEKDN